MKPTRHGLWFVSAACVLPVISTAFMCALWTQSASGQFTTIINVPPDPAPTEIDSDTQLNLLDGGTLPIAFQAGQHDGTSDNVEVNITGGTVGRYFDANSGSVITISGGTVRNGFHANSGSVVSITGGTVDGRFRARSGSVVTLSGGAVKEGGGSDPGSTMTISGGSLGSDFYASGDIIISDGIVGDWFHAPGASVTIAGGTVGKFFRAYFDSKVTITGGTVGGVFEAAGSNVTITGGTVGDYFHAQVGSDVTVSGGAVGKGFNADSGSEVTISGGMVGDNFWAQAGSKVNLLGTEFLLDGVPIADLSNPGDRLVLIERGGQLLTGTLADGSPFDFVLNGEFVSVEEDVFEDSAVLRLMLVPEPTSAELAFLATTLVVLCVYAPSRIVSNRLRSVV